VQEALKRLFSNLRSVELPLALLSQFFPLQYRKVRDGLLSKDPEDLVKDWIGMTLEDYFYAVSPQK
jgi:D-tagatose-1,6-bisphosphate aldolase subunit GatZ/KbaZ